jgi:predicted anti-sigma-YlaC factor YlaD
MPEQEHERFKQLLMGRLDGELSPEQERELDEHLQTCAECREELTGFRRMNEMAGRMRFSEPQDEVWDAYWRGIYNRLERGVGWILVSLGAILLLGFGAFRLVETLLTDPTVELVVKIGLSALLLGVVVLVVSLVRERVFGLRSDRYSREVKR